MNANAQQLGLTTAPGQRLFRALVLRSLDKIKSGQITISDKERVETYGTPSVDRLSAQIHIHNPGAYKEICLRGSIGAADAYVRGDWSTPNLLDLVRVLARNIDAVDQMESGLSRIYTQCLKLLHRFRHNSRAGAQANIGAHYDLSNDFFALFLDEHMMYSSAIYPEHDSNLDDAASHKLQVICEKLGLREDHHLLEIGTGWGGLAIYAATHFGCKVTTTTISAAQFEYAQQRVKALGLESQVTVLNSDYRDLTGVYDRLVSVEMIEAVGHRYLDTFFASCQRLLKDDGCMLIQAITIAEHRYERARREVDFIQRYIFPGGALPSLGSMCASIARSTCLQPQHVQSYAEDYARTLANWRHRFAERLDDVRRLGFDDNFIRLWDLYLNYCEGGFRESTISLLHMVLAGPRHQPQAVLSDAGSFNAG